MLLNTGAVWFLAYVKLHFLEDTLAVMFPGRYSANLQGKGLRPPPLSMPKAGEKGGGALRLNFCESK